MRHIVLISIFLLLTSTAFSEEVRLRSGAVKNGTITERTEEDITLKDGDTTFTIPFSLIDPDQIAALKTAPLKTAASEPQAASSPAAAAAPEESAQTILDKIAAKYAALETCKVEGTASMDVDSAGLNADIPRQNLHRQTNFTLLLKKPNLYLVTWTAKGLGAMDAGPSAIWNAGEQAYFYESANKLYSKVASNEVALAEATGFAFLSAPPLVPALFAKLTSEEEPFKHWTNLKRETDEAVDGTDCFVVSAGSPVSEKETIWISKADYFIVKYVHSLKPPPGGIQMPETSDEALEAQMKKMGLPITPESKAALRAQIEQMTEKMKDLKLSGAVEVNYKTTSSPNLAQADFAFAVPEGVTARESLPASVDEAIKLSQEGRAKEEIARLDQAKTEEERFCALGPAAKAYYVQGKKAEAQKLAEELTGLMPKYPGHWNYGNAVQDTNIVLGRIALSEGRLDEAKKRLLDAGRTPGSPQLDSFGPSMSLAKELLEKGEKDVVLQYLELCGKFWKMDHGQLTKWADDVKAGKTPDFSIQLAI